MQSRLASHKKTSETQKNIGDPGVETGWVLASITSGCNRILLEGLTPLQRVWVRLRGINGDGPGLWTDPAGEVVL